ncbi:MAG: hypothetical protein ACKKMP_00360 [Candidatus Nealsonbacteria bacterium]
MALETIIQFILNPALSGNLLILKLVFIILSLLFILFIIFALIKTDWVHQLMIWDWMEFLTYKYHGLATVKKRWVKVREKSRISEAETRLAIVEADNLLNEILIRMGFKGQSLKERLDPMAPDILENIEQVKKAHQVRLNMVANPDYHLDPVAARKILQVYEEALENLQVL